MHYLLRYMYSPTVIDVELYQMPSGNKNRLRLTVAHRQPI